MAGPGRLVGRQYQPPEIVLENEVPIGSDGTVKVAIDTTLAKELHGDQDHKYSITAEVVDESRRTIVGSGEVLVARKPFKVYAWVDRGHYRAGDTIKALLLRPDSRSETGPGQGRTDPVQDHLQRQGRNRSKRPSKPGSSTPTPRARPRSK